MTTTPRPWFWDADGNHMAAQGGQTVFWAPPGSYAGDNMEDDGPLIQRSVNAHDALVKAARRALNTLKGQGESVRPGNVLGALEAALKLAEG